MGSDKIESYIINVNKESMIDRYTQRPFVSNYFEIGPVIYDKKIFMYTFGYQGKQKSAYTQNSLIKGEVSYAPTHGFSSSFTW